MSHIDREAFIAGLHTDRLKPDQIEAFFGGLGERIPGPGTNPDRVPVHEDISRRLHELARQAQVPHPAGRSDGELASEITERMRGFESERWTEASGATSLLDDARQAVGEIAADLAELRAIPLHPPD